MHALLLYSVGFVVGEALDLNYFYFLWVVLSVARLPALSYSCEYVKELDPADVFISRSGLASSVKNKIYIKPIVTGG